MTVALLLLAAWAQPVNDRFPGTLLSGSPVTALGMNVGATAEAGEPNPGIWSGPRSVWWSWMAPTSGRVTVSTLGSTFDTTLGVYVGSVVTSLGVVAENDDGPVDHTSRVTFNARAGIVYRIQVNGWFGETGSIMLHLSGLTNAVDWINPPLTMLEPGESFSVIWNLTGAATGHTNVHWDSVSPPTSSSSAVQTGEPGSYAAVLTAPLSPGTWYYQAHALIGGTDVLSTIRTVTVVSAAPPVNDNFPGILGLGTVNTGTSVGSTREVGEPNPAGCSGTRSVWWTWTPSVTGGIEITTAGSTFDTTLGVYTGMAVDALTLIVQDNDDGLSATSTVSFLATGGTAYRIQVNGSFGDSGEIVLTLAPWGGGSVGNGGAPCGSFGLDLMFPAAVLWLVRRLDGRRASGGVGRHRQTA